MRRLRSVVFFFLIVSTTTLFARASDVMWNVTWYHMDAPGDYCYYRQLDCARYPFCFAFDWGTASIISHEYVWLLQRCSRNDRIGFIADCSFFVPMPGRHTVAVTANNGVELYVDGQTVLSSWQRLVNGAGERSLNGSIYLEAGLHTFELRYYEWDGSAKLSFETDLEPMGLEEVVGLYEGALGAIDELEAYARHANETVAELQGCVEVLEDELVSSEEAYATLSGELASSESREQILQGNVEQLEKELAASEADCTTLSGELASSELRERSLGADIRVLRDDVADLSQQLEASALRIANLEADVLVANRAATDASARLGRQSQRMDAFITGSAEVLDAITALQAVEDDLASRHGQRFTHSLIADIEAAMDDVMQQLWSATAIAGVGEQGL